MASCGECKCEIASAAAEVEDVARSADVPPEHVGNSLAVMHGVGKEIGPRGEIEPIFVVQRPRQSVPLGSEALVPPLYQSVNLIALEARVLDQVLHDVDRSPSEIDLGWHIDLFSAMGVQEEMRSHSRERPADGNRSLVSNGVGRNADA